MLEPRLLQKIESLLIEPMHVSIRTRPLRQELYNNSLGSATRTVFELRPMAPPFQAEYVPDGSV